MEAAVLSGTLNVVANKLAPLVIKQYSSIVGVTKDLRELKDLVEEINCFLERIGYEAKGNDSSLNWLKKLKDVAYTADDIVDEFQLKAEEHDAALATNGGIMSDMWTKPKSFIFQCKVASKVKAIKKEFATIVKQRTDFSAIANSLPVGHPVRHINNTIVAIPSLPIVDEALVLGRDEEKCKIISKLVESNNQHGIKVISIIGLGGSGKTTLAKLVFNDKKIIAKHFEVRLWVHVSQEFDVEKLVQKLFEAFSDNDPGQHELPYMSKTISDKLDGKRFLLVLDDVWTELPAQWEEFIIYLKKGTPESRVLLTTRSSSSAKTVLLNTAETVPPPSTYLFDLPLLSQDDSWQLFQQSLIMPVEGWGFEFQEVGKEIVSKCGGLPLAIKVLAGVLRDKKLLKEWQTIRDSNLLDADGKEHRVFACLRLSYSYLSPHLRQCFTMCSLLPKGYRIDKEQLIDQWIAHDMIPLTDGDDLEHIGDKYFNSLVQISFLQDVDESSGGRMRCTMHDLVHDLARSILSDEISPVLPKDATNSTKRYRYFSLTEGSRNRWSKHLCEKARAIYVACGQYFIFDKAFRNAKHLRSITVECICTIAVPTTILQIKNLRYLHISRLACETLPEAISDVWSLQSLHITDSYLVELPRSIGKLQKLRAVNLSYCCGLESLPDSLGDCQMISSIDLYSCKRFTTLPNSICKNKHLRVLRLGLTRIERIPSGITALENLECLDLRRCYELVELPEGIGNLKNLVVMNLQGCRRLESMPVGIGQLSQLQKLGLFAVKEGESFAKISELGNIGKIDRELTLRGIARGMDPYEAQKACLKQRTNLQSLTLIWETNGRANTKNELAVLYCLEPPYAITCLEVIGYAGRRYAWWLLKQGGDLRFPWLSMLELSDFPRLKHLHGLVELPCLEKLVLTGMPCLESISGGPFPSLVELDLRRLPRLGELWIVTERNLAVGEEGSGYINSIPRMGLVQIGNYLSCLTISECPELKIKPYMPASLQILILEDGNEQLLQSPGQGQGSSWSSSDADLRPSFSNFFGHLKELRLWSMLFFFARSLWSMLTVASSPSSGSGFGCEREALQHLMELETLQISNFHCLTELPESMWSLTSLQNLIIAYCSALVQLPERLGELRSLQTLWIEGLPGLRSFPQSLQHLTSLVSLKIAGCDELDHLPECLGELHSLTNLMIWNLPGLTCLPQSMRRLTSLEELLISECPGLTSLPEWISELTALELLQISGCPVLMRRYKRGKGEDCHLTDHIRYVL